MRIGIDCRTILNPEAGERAGVGHYTYHLIRTLLDIDRENEYVLFFDYRMPREATQEFMQANTTIKFFPFSSYGKFLPFAYSHMLVSAALLKERLTVFHAPANVAPLTYPRKTVVTIHDLAIYHHPEWFPTQLFSTRLLVPRSVKRAKQIIAVSQATKRDLRELFNVPAQKIQVVPEAADTALLDLHDKRDDVVAKYRLNRKYLLFVGTIDPRKNLVTLFKAWQRLKTMRPEAVKHTDLVLAGGIGYGGEHIIPQIKKMKLASSVKYLSYVSQNHKILLMKHAAAFVFPTLYEGFGLPVLEAMQLGVPVITTNTSSVPEVTGSAALLVDPNDVEGLAMAMKNILTNPTTVATLRRKGKAQAAKFSWTKTAKATLKVYHQAVSKK
ncbi:MAG: glycosyltransferase family 4 protein [Candidatus Kerfeldbacteria bacterium]|nr:glycosyltransferase family 4 protein [Candidatus Kerfeldbacteria bacterium]